MLKQVFAVDLDSCPKCGGPVRWLEAATTEDAIACLMAPAHSLDPEMQDEAEPHPLCFDEPGLAACYAAAAQGVLGAHGERRCRASDVLLPPGTLAAEKAAQHGRVEAARLCELCLGPVAIL